MSDEITPDAYSGPPRQLTVADVNHLNDIFRHPAAQSGDYDRRRFDIHVGLVIYPLAHCFSLLSSRPVVWLA